MNSHASMSATTTRSLSLSALLQVLPAPTATRCQNAAESGWKFRHARSLSEAWSAASIWRLAASDAISSMAAPTLCPYRDSGVDSGIRRVLIVWSVWRPPRRVPAVARSPAERLRPSWTP